MNWYKRAQLEENNNFDINRVTYQNDHLNYSYGQHDLKLSAYLDGNQIGYVSYTIYNGQLTVKNIFVEEEYRRHGIATRMMDEVHRENKEEEYKPSGRTPEGSAFFDQYEKPSASRLEKSLKEQYPQLEELWITEKDDRIDIKNIRLYQDSRSQGIGENIVRQIQEYARANDKFIIIEPEADPGKKGKLNNFWTKKMGFKKNRDSRYTSMFAPTMIWRPE